MKKNIGQLAGEIYALLEGQAKEDNIRILASVTTLLGINAPIAALSQSVGNPEHAGSQNNFAPSANAKNAKNYFDKKAPASKGEEFAVAAKFRIDNELGDIHTKEDFKAVIKAQARRVFDEGNFARDMDNAIRQAKFFMTGDQKGQFILSAGGERYVDALPDRAAAAEVRKATKIIKKAKKKGAKK